MPSRPNRPTMPDRHHDAGRQDYEVGKVSSRQMARLQREHEARAKRSADSPEARKAAAEFAFKPKPRPTS